jgi:chromosome partitioning protein
VIVSVVGSKGGTGKTTVAVGLATSRARDGRETLLLDADPRGSAVTWNQNTDNGLGCTVLGYAATTIHRDLPSVAEKYDDVVIDTPGQDQAIGIIRSAVLAADVAVLPVAPSSMELVELSPMLDLAEGCGRPALILLTRAISTTRSYRDAVGLLQDTAGSRPGVWVAELVIPEWEWFRQVWGVGEGGKVAGSRRVKPIWEWWGWEELWREVAYVAKESETD